MSFVVFERFRSPVKQDHVTRVTLSGIREIRVPDSHEIQADVMLKTIEAAALGSLSEDMNKQIINALSHLRADIWKAAKEGELGVGLSTDLSVQVSTLIDILSSGMYLLQPEKILNGD